jgi:hypothetical protein
VHTYTYTYIYRERDRDREREWYRRGRERGREGGRERERERERESARALQEIEGTVCSMLSRITCELAVAAHVRRQASLST